MTLTQQLHGSKTHKIGNDPACPQCVRHVQLADALRAIDAKQIASIDGPNGSTLGYYTTAHGVLIVQWYAKEQGFEVYVPICRSNKIADTLNAMRALGAMANVNDQI